MNETVHYPGLDVHKETIAAASVPRATPPRGPATAQSLHRAQSYLGDLYRRWRARLGRPKAITALAHT